MQKIRRLLRKLGPKTRFYRIGEVDIRINREHRLPDYQARHRMYDRFLPTLASGLDSLDGWIVDVGANVGDTTAAISQSCRNPVLAVEGDPEFYGILVENLSQLRSGIVPSRHLVGTGTVGGALVQDGTTATRGIGSASGTVTLDDLLRMHGVPITSVSLIKTDTDGYDADVLLSCKNTIAASGPAIYWENEFRSDTQQAELEAVYATLHELGYRWIWVFDNFGHLMLSEVSFDTLKQINAYVRGMSRKGGPRSIMYTDILAVTDRRLEDARRSVENYRRKIQD